MKNPSSLPDTSRVSERLFLPSLVISRFALQPPLLIASLLLLDISIAFDQPIGITGQIRTIAALVAAIAAVLMSLWSIRFKSKTLLMIGLLLCCFAGFVAFSARNFAILLAAYALSGLGFALIDPMLYTLVGEYFLMEKRARAIGWILTGAALANIIGTPIIGTIVGIRGWQFAFLGFALPTAFLSFILTMKAVPTSSQNNLINKGQYMDGFKEIISNKSAIACLMGTALSYASWQAVTLYGVSFIRQRFLVSLGFASIVVLANSSCFIFGSQIGGRLVNKFGRQRVTVLSVFFVGVLILVLPHLRYLWLALTVMFLDAWFDGVRATAGNSLMLEQVPQFRGSVMALNSAARNMGNAMGAGLGGLALLWASYEGLGLTLGVLGIVAALAYWHFVQEPSVSYLTRKQ